MCDKKVVAEILALASRLDRGEAGIEDILRAEVVELITETPGASSHFNGEVFDAMNKLILTAKRGVNRKDRAYKMLQEKFHLIYYGLRRGKLGCDFFALIGNNQPPQ